MKHFLDKLSIYILFNLLPYWAPTSRYIDGCKKRVFMFKSRKQVLSTKKYQFPSNHTMKITALRRLSPPKGLLSAYFSHAFYIICYLMGKSFGSPLFLQWGASGERWTRINFNAGFMTYFELLECLGMDWMFVNGQITDILK